MKKTIDPTTPAVAGTTPAGAVQWRCKVTKEGAGKSYGANKHKRGLGALVLLTDEEVTAAESQKWVTREGISNERRVAAPAAEETAPAATEA